MCPDINDLVISFIICDESHVVIVHHLINLLVTLVHKFGLLARNDYIIEVKG